MNNTRAGLALLFVFFVTIVLSFAAACFVVLHAVAPWPTWLQVVIALPAGLQFFLSWAKATETNGFGRVDQRESPKDR